MSTNDLARQKSSRRSFLTAGAAALAGTGTGIMPAAAAPASLASDRTDAAFRLWLAVQAECEVASDYSDEWIAERTDKLAEIEAEITKGEPSIMAAGALTLFTLRWNILWPHTKPAELRDDQIHSSPATAAYAVLPFLMAGLTGCVCEVAADLLAHPDREVRHSLLMRGQAGEA